MPGRDGTGPAGTGPMTGRAAGYCAGYVMPGNPNPAFGRGFGLGFGRGRGFGGCGRGWRNGFNATGRPGWMRFGGNDAPYQVPDAETEKQELKDQAEAMRSELEAIDKRLAELEPGTASK